MKEPLLSVNGLRKYYPVRKDNPFAKTEYLKAVDGIDFEVFEGETLGLVGESGCGKSTTGQMLVNLLQPTAGQVLYRGQAINRLAGAKRKAVCKRIQIVFQDPYTSLNPKKTIGWLLAEPLHIHGMYSTQEECDQAVENMLQMVGLDAAFANRYPHELSGGQRQRISIAIALMLKPEFVVADEPVSALDVSIQAQVLNLLKNLQAELGLTYLFISHDLNVVQYISDRIGVMYMGRLVEIGSAAAVCEKPLHPYTKALFSTIPSLHRTGGQKRIILQGDPPDPVHLPPGCPFHTRCFSVLPVCRASMPAAREVAVGHMVACHLHHF